MNRTEGSERAGSPARKKSPPKAKEERPRRPPWWAPDPRPATQIFEDEVFLTKQMLARVLGYRNVRSIDLIVAEDCASEAPCLQPIYLRRPHAEPNDRRPPGAPSFKSVRFRREDVIAYVEKMREPFPADLEWRFGGRREPEGS
ncbi:MAG: hypothetical protein O2807_06170 [bacterium]|nr:hypothetical protein [bacterium]